MACEPLNRFPSGFFFLSPFTFACGRNGSILEAWFSGEHSSARLTVGLDVRGLVQSAMIL